jgi:carnitine O-acetyltransferase
LALANDASLLAGLFSLGSAFYRSPLLQVKDLRRVNLPFSSRENMTSKLSRLHRDVLTRSSMFGYRQLSRGPNLYFQISKLPFHHDLRFSSSLMKSWPKDVYKCDGDYRKETFLEEYIGGPLYENRKELPRLPIPSIKETIERFLPTALPLAKTKEEEMALRAACETFPEEAKMLQKRLQDKREKEMKDSSWLQMWWNQLSYLQFRDSVVYNVSYFLHFKDDPTIDTLESGNVQRAAAALFATAEFRKQVCTGQLAPEKIGKQQTQLCSTAYKYMFNACRIPCQEQDSYWIYDPSRFTHAIVARKGHFFSIDFVDDSGDALPISVIERQLEKCIEIADTIPASRPKLGVLTSSNRDNWAAVREKLRESGGSKMEEALEKLQSGSVVVNLDDVEPISRQDCGELFLSGGLKSGENRWFDKSINIMVAENGKAAVLGEHSMMDGMPLVNYADYVTKVTYADAKSRSGEGSEDTPEVVDIFAEAIEQMDHAAVEDARSKGRTRHFKFFHHRSLLFLILFLGA